MPSSAPVAQPQPYGMAPTVQEQWGRQGQQPGYGQWGMQGQQPGYGQWGMQGQQPATNQWGVPMQGQGSAQWGMQGQAAPPGQGWPPVGVQQMPQQAAPYTPPPAENPWRKPPSGFGSTYAPQQYPWQVPQPAAPQFRPLEEEQGKQPYRSGVPQVAPYDRPMGSSQDSPAAAWPGYYPPYQGYWGAPNPWAAPVW